MKRKIEFAPTHILESHPKETQEVLDVILPGWQSRLVFVSDESTVGCFAEDDRLSEISDRLQMIVKSEDRLSTIVLRMAKREDDPPMAWVS